MYPRVLSVPRVGQFIRSGRYAYLHILGETECQVLDDGNSEARIGASAGVLRPSTALNRLNIR